MSRLTSFFKFFTSFRFLPMCGLIMGSWIYSIHTEQQPLSMYLLEIKTYLIAFLIVLGLRLFVWLTFERATFYDIKGLVKSILVDFSLFVLMMWSVIGTLFLFNTFIIKIL